MKYLKNLWLSIRSIFGIMLILYSLLILSFFLFGKENATKGAYLLVLLFQIGYIIYIYRKEKFTIKTTVNYFPFILIGTSIAIIFNMFIFKIGIKFEVNYHVSPFTYIISSSIIGPIFEELIFRHKLVPRLRKFNSKMMTILLSGIIFSFCHANHIVGIYALIVGFILAYFYLKYQNILIPIIIHISGNLIVNLLFDYNTVILILGIIILILGIFGVRIENKKIGH